MVHIIGYSMGARIAARLIVDHPDRFLSATLAAGAGQLGWSRADAEVAELEASEMERGSMRSLALRLAPPDRPRLGEDEIRRRAETFLAGQDLPALAAVRRAYGGFAISLGEASAVTVPTLGLVGNSDPARAALEQLRQLRPSLKLVILDGATHVDAARHPQFLPALRG
ncbi:MAG: alpha/beta hydrolase, partial [Nitrospira sp.]|nr:alpha/beta hydrolase [Nitrospira sp.]